MTPKERALGYSSYVAYDAFSGELRLGGDNRWHHDRQYIPRQCARCLLLGVGIHQSCHTGRNVCEKCLVEEDRLVSSGEFINVEG